LISLTYELNNFFYLIPDVIHQYQYYILVKSGLTSKNYNNKLNYDVK